MKDITEWGKKPNPREMWVWDNDEESKVKRFVIFIEPNSNVYPYIRVIVWNALTGDLGLYKHCAEIDDEEPRRMTNYELALWIQRKPGRQVRYKNSEYSLICTGNYDYCLREEDDIVPPELLVREDKGEWHQPMLDEYLEENQGGNKDGE